MSGLIIILPVFFTLYFLIFLVRLMDGAWGRFINMYLRKHYGFMIPGLGLIFAAVTIFLVGFAATHLIGKRFSHALESWFLKFPIIRQVYPALKQIVASFVSKESQAFKKVVMVEYPSKGIWTVGFLTNDSFEKAEKAAGTELLHVFIATTPSPLTGFLILMPKSEVKILDISIEEGVKLIVSGGIVKPIR